MRFFSQLGLLLWKNVLLQRRKVAVSVFEVLLPVLFACIILTIRIITKPERYDNATFYAGPNPADRLEDYGFMFVPAGVMEMGFTPDTPLTRVLMDGVQTDLNVDLLTYPFNVSVKGFSTEDDLVDYYKIHSDKMLYGVVFKGLDQASVLPLTVTYYIRPKTGDSERWRTANTFPFYQNGEPRSSSPDYLYSGFLAVQSTVAKALMREWNGVNTSSLSLRVQRMPYPPYISDPMVQILQTQMPLFFILSFILSVIQGTKNIVYEKERKLKESMKLMGLMPSAHWVSWFITCYAYLAVAMAIYAVLFGVNIIKKSGPVLAFSDPSLFYVFLLCYAAAIVSFCFMISVFVQKANVGAAVAGVMFFAFYLPNFFLNTRYETMTAPQKLAACLLFNQAMAFGANVIGLYEGTGEGARWSNFHRSASVDDNFTLLDAMIMLLIDTAIHLIITWYLDNVRPGEFGVPKPLYFCFTKSYWCGSEGPRVQSYEADKADKAMDEKHFERDPVGLTAGIKICNLRKVFGKNKVAVDNLSLNMYEGQITVLLGHNGAGKTTTMSMLTGFIPPSSGTAYINGKDIRTDIDSVRESLGLCPQHNILFGTLTVEEHLIFFAKLKGCPSNKVKQEVDTMIKEVGLEYKRNSAARTLSGGQKRKLSVAIALINGSKIIVLDEPSSGMDPAARRQTWEILQRHRAGRTMLLTTHFMDEADVLGDRIAIMAEGVVKCCGTSMFLKKLYGAGYHLVIVKTPDCKVAQVTRVIQDAIPTAQMESDINAELSYLLPDDQSARFPDMLRSLENQKQELGIVDFGATATTMEEVFLKVGESASMEDDDVVVPNLEGIVNSAFDGDKLVSNGTGNAENSRMQSMSIATEGAALDVLAFSRGYKKVTGVSLLLSRLRGLLVKKAIHFWRNRIITLVQLLLPVIFTVIALAIDKARPQTLTEPALAFNLNPFGDTTIPYSNGSSPNALTDTLADVYAGQFSNRQNRPKVSLSQQPMADYLLSTAAQLGTTTYNKRVIVGAQFDQLADGSVRAVGWFNGQPYHAQPVSLAYTISALAAHYVNDSVSIRSGVDPFPKNEDADAEVNLFLALGTGFSVGFCISIGMAFLTTSFIYFLIKEKIVGAKHMQVVSGVDPVVFWLGNLMWDYVNYLLPSLLLLVVFAAYGTEAYVDGGRLGVVALVLALYGWAILPFVYLAHFLFSSPPTGMVVVIVFNIFSGLITMTTVFVMGIIPDVQALGETLNWVFLALFPNHCMARSFMAIYTNYLYADFCVSNLDYRATCLVRQSPCCKNYGMGCKENSDVCFDFTENYLAWDSNGIGRYLVFMAIHGFVFIVLTLLLEYRFFQRLCSCLSCVTRSGRSYSTPQPFYINGASVTSEDDDVAAERRRINASPASVLSQRDSLLLVNLFKQYGDFVAVDHTCVGVPEQECFGLLGQNGAGKTTTFKMLTGDVPVTGGNAYLKGYDVKNNLQQVQANMGYCPQFDALIDQMTGRETLTMYARLRGVPEDNIRMSVNNLIDVLLLRPHADKLTSDYSGGNKRKLSTAMALIGDPPFILLDEPSSGMDPGARRQLWNVLSQVRASGRTLVLTSHSMEECEALCTRIAIMVNGRFVCLGSTQHLKSKFGQGYTIVVKMASDDSGVGGGSAPVEPLVAYIQQCFPSARLFDSHQGYAHVQVPDPDVRLADVFDVMERAKRELHVQDYNVHQTTLEQVFLAFTRVQAPPKDSNKRSCLRRFCCCCC